MKWKREGRLTPEMLAKEEALHKWVLWEQRAYERTFDDNGGIFREWHRKLYCLVKFDSTSGASAGDNPR